MFKQFQKFAFFLSNEISEESTADSDKVVKYLYRKEPHHGKVKNERARSTRASFSEDYTTDDGYQKHRMKSREPILKKPTKFSTSETDIYFLPSKEFKRNRKHLENGKAESSRRKDNKKKYVVYKTPGSYKQSKDFSRKHSRHKRSFPKDTYPWLCPKDILEFINNIKDRTNLDFFKKIFSFDKRIQNPEPHNEKLKPETNHRSGDNFDIIFIPVKSSAYNKMKTLAKGTDRYREKYPKRSVDVLMSKLFKNNSNVVNNERQHLRRRSVDSESVYKDLHERRRKNKQRLASEEWDLPHNRRIESKRASTSISCYRKRLENFETFKTNPKYKSKDSFDRKLKNICKPRSLRHGCYYLVQNTFSVIHITPSNSSSSVNLEKKKKENNRHLEHPTNKIHHVCDKIYKKVSESHITKKHSDEKNLVQNNNLGLETNVTSFTMGSHNANMICNNSTHHCRSGKEKVMQTKRTPFKSKIPVLKNNPKRVSISNNFKELPLATEREEALRGDSANRRVPQQNKKVERFKKKPVIRLTAQLNPVPVQNEKKRVVQNKSIVNAKKHSKVPINKLRNMNLQTPQPTASNNRSPNSSRTKSKTILIKNKSGTTQNRYKASASNSTFSGDKSIRLSTSIDNNILSRIQKQKMYSERLRKRFVKNKPKSVPSPVVEVRHVTIDNDNSDAEIKQTKNKAEIPIAIKEFYKNDLPEPYLELVECDRYKEIFETPVDKDLNDILNENYTFLNKDFSFSLSNLSEASSEENLFTDDSLFMRKKKTACDWHDLSNVTSLNEIPQRKGSVDVSIQNSNLNSQDNIIGSISPPRSEDSGYRSVNFHKISRSFFEQPKIKALLRPCETKLSSCFLEIQVERSSSSNCVLDIRSVQSKSLQAIVQCSQKSVQIKWSKGDNLGESGCLGDKKQEFIEENGKSQSVQVICEKKVDGNMSDEMLLKTGESDEISLEIEEQNSQKSIQIKLSEDDNVEGSSSTDDEEQESVEESGKLHDQEKKADNEESKKQILLGNEGQSLEQPALIKEENLVERSSPDEENQVAQEELVLRTEEITLENGEQLIVKEVGENPAEETSAEAVPKKTETALLDSLNAEPNIVGDNCDSVNCNVSDSANVEETDNAKTKTKPQSNRSKFKRMLSFLSCFNSGSSNE